MTFVTEFDGPSIEDEKDFTAHVAQVTPPPIQKRK